MTQTFEGYVAEWDTIIGKMEALKKQLKPLADKEMEMRKAIFAAVQTAMTTAGDWKEGTNSYEMPDGRKLKVVNEIKREIEIGLIPAALKAYELQKDKPVAFDTLLRVKYELEKAQWNKLAEEAKKAISVMVSAKPGTPQVTLD